MQGIDLAGSTLDIGQRLALGQLEGELGGGGPLMLLQQVAQQRLLDMGRHQIDADPLSCSQRGEICEYPLQQLGGYRQDQPLLFDIVDKGARRNQFTAAPPTQQRLEANDFSGSAIHYRLVEGFKLLIFQTDLQQSLQRALIVAMQPVGTSQQDTQRHTNP